MKRKMNVDKMLSLLKNEDIHTWFDLGIFLDRFKENNPIPAVEFYADVSELKEEIGKGGIAFVTYLYSVDGVTIEVEKYAKIFRNIINDVKIHYISGKFYPESQKIIDPRTVKYELKEILGFDDWPLYRKFFFTKLERGSKEYNQLIREFWEEVLVITEKLGRYIEKNEINLLYLINVCSNPGNISLSLATVFISEYLGIPVINNNHDFYWEGGNRKIDIEKYGLKEGPRDFFFTNSDIGEVFSIIEVLFPWKSRTWINVNINKKQSAHIIEKKGHNPANVAEIGTAVDTNEFLNISKRRKIQAYYQFEKVLSRYSDDLHSYCVADIIKEDLVRKEDPKPILVGAKTRKIENFLSENIIFLQPTRIIARKRIELGFKLLKRLFNDQDLIERLKKTQNLKITLIITGPIALGHYEYFITLLSRFSQFLEILNQDIREKVYLAFLFSEFDKDSFKKYFKDPVGIPELYNIASLVLLPSKTEGRGLPIIEATACGTPIFCRRYMPLDVYTEVIGENLKEKDRLKVIEFDGKKITSKHAKQIFHRVLFPHKFADEINHNRNAVKRRFSLEALSKSIEYIFTLLAYQLKSNNESISFTREALKELKKISSFSNEDLQFIINTKNRQYMPGYGKLAFMLNLKSLIDPSAFRMEEQQIQGYAFKYAQDLVECCMKKEYIFIEKIIKFYDAVDNIFNYREGEVTIRHDHSFAYRHRNKNHYPYREFTIQEIFGLIVRLFLDIIDPRCGREVDENSHFFTDWDLALAQFTSSTNIAIDDRKILIRKMQENIPLGIFIGEYAKTELEFFVLQVVRSRLKLKIENELTEDILKSKKETLAPVFIFVRKKSFGKWYGKDEIIQYLKKGHERELRLLYTNNILKIIETEQFAEGLNFPQMGEKTIRVLRRIKERKGILITTNSYASVTTDCVDIDRVHIGQARQPITAGIMGIPIDSGYIQFVPAGVRTCLAYPTPVQTDKSFREVLKSKLFRDLAASYGREKLFEILKTDSEKRGSPAQYVLQNLQKLNKKEGVVEYKYVSGLYEDGMPWNGAFASIKNNFPDKRWYFNILSSSGKTKRVTTFIKEFEKQRFKHVAIAWNGGYILNPELVGKLGIPESYIGSPLGLLITDKKVQSPPLFNKAALLIDENGKLDIKKVNSKNGILVRTGNTVIELTSENYNLKKPSDQICYYDLLFEHEKIPCEKRVIIRLAGNVIKDVIKKCKDKQISILPVGLTLSFPEDKFPRELDDVGRSLDISIKGIENIEQAVEAGPLLVKNGKVAIDMEDEGWTTTNSIRTQAARLDYTDMRGPKIAVGLDESGKLSVLTINGRIRESVGATHHDMAKIMIDLGVKKAMGFDPGGSSTLVIEGKTLNISPYNHNYEYNIYTLPPEPRAVSNAVVGYIE